MDPSNPNSSDPVGDTMSVAKSHVEPGNHANVNAQSTEQRGVKRPADDDLLNDDASDNNAPHEEAKTTETMGGRKRREAAETYRQTARQASSEAREKEEEIAAAQAEGRQPVLRGDRKRHRSMTGCQVPIGIIIDCQFEKYMNDAELISLSSQVTRCYSDNRGALHPAHLYISSYGGKLKERNETILKNHHLKWKNIQFWEGDFVEAAKDAKDRMMGPQGGQVIDLLKQSSTDEKASIESSAPKSTPIPEPEGEDVDKSIVYLTADSPYTLERLEPNTCYVIGGIIDKNREKGLCYQVARGKKVRTAKLPIGEYMILQHRHVLATNHVLEIMLKWLETGDWGKAFMEIIPKRREGKLKTNEDTPTETPEAELVDENGDNNVDDETQKADSAQADAQGALTTQNGNDTIEVEGDNAEDGLAKNSLDEPRWSAPPLELETAAEEKEKPANIASS